MSTDKFTRGDGTRRTSETAAIHIDDLTKVYDTPRGEELVFEDLSASIEAGSFTSVIGRSGSGKSTLLSIMNGTVSATSGSIYFEQGGEQAESAEIGQVFQEPRLLPWESCKDNIELVNENNDAYTDETAQELLDLVGLSEHYDKYPTELSGGQQQRVGIARALSISPDILLMDEPFSNLDELTAKNMRDEIIEIWRELQKTVVFVTHDITEAIQLSDRILMMGGGEIYCDLSVPLSRPRDVTSNEFASFRQEAVAKFEEIQE
ncbi:ABC transporter ATP-binding protein [Halorientalis marina]|jgi:NitT/TauT family transport system ATP-binding protein|uniref:ABC transporter ATP-binding protein n=1 Tax=Halorientalis marina TaxID=2931976 RepID=UPI001FF20310|nr:ABC transporter ATP-binding protein [Halorientalis marina]